jgi:Flp pilus assembly protein TadG
MRLAGDDRGFITVQFVAAVGFSLLLFVLIANLVVVQYARGVVRSAAEEGARAGSSVSAVEADCEARAQEVLGALLGGPMGDRITVTCDVTAVGVTASVQYAFSPWLPLVPSWAGTESSFAVKEAVP